MYGCSRSQTIVMQWKSAIKIRTQHEVYDGHRLYVGIRANVCDISMLKENRLVLVDSLYCDTLASVVETANIKIHRVIYDEVGTIEVVLRVLPAQMIWMISASLYTMLKDSPPDAKACVHLYCMRTRTKFPEPFSRRSDASVNQLSSQAVSPTRPYPPGRRSERHVSGQSHGPTMDKRRYMTPTFTTISILKGFKKLCCTVPNTVSSFGTRPRSKIVARRGRSQVSQRGPEDRFAVASKNRVQRLKTKRNVDKRFYNVIQTAKICTLYRWRHPAK
jgi:hypothetical protein